MMKGGVSQVLEFLWAKEKRGDPCHLTNSPAQNLPYKYQPPQICANPT